MKLAKFIGLIGCIVLVSGFISAFYYYAPIFKQLPTPTGSHAIGTTIYYLKDDKRPEIHDPVGKSVRELKVQVWYPAIADAQHIPWDYLIDIMPALKEDSNKKLPYSLPDSLLNRMLKMPTHALTDGLPAVKAGPYPVVVFSHGFGASVGWYSAYIEELVSQGYVVVGINHTYATNYVKFPDGRVIKFNQEGTLDNNEKAHVELAVWVADQQFVIDWLEKAQQGDTILKDMLNLQKIGVAGHSFGGVTALKTCGADARCSAAANLDGSLSFFDNELEQPLTKPALFMMQDHRREEFIKQLSEKSISNEEHLKYRAHLITIFQKSTLLAYMMVLEQASHHSFSDAVLIKYPLAWLFDIDIGEMEGYLALKTVNQYLVSFFDCHLKDVRSSVLLEQLKKGEINYIG